MTIRQNLTKRILPKIVANKRELALVLLTNPHQTPLFETVINHLKKIGFKKIIFIVDERIKGALPENLFLNCQVEFHHPAIELVNISQSFRQIKFLKSLHPDLVVSMSSVQSYERVLFDNLNCPKILIIPHHADRYYGHFEPETIQKAKIFNFFIWTLQISVKIFSAIGFKFFVQKMVLFLLEKRRGITTEGEDRLEERFFKIFDGYTSSPDYREEVLFLAVGTLIFGLRLGSSFSVGCSCAIGSKPTRIICLDSGDRGFYEDWFSKLRWNVDIHSILLPADFIRLNQETPYHVVICTPAGLGLEEGFQILNSCLETLSRDFDVHDLSVRVHPNATQEVKNTYEGIRIKWRKVLELRENSVSGEYQKLYISGPSSIIPDIYDDGPVIIIPEIGLRHHRIGVSSYPGTYQMISKKLIQNA